VSTVKDIEPVVLAAVDWWISNRPLTWTTEDHLKFPAVNVAGEDAKALAVAVANYCGKIKSQMTSTKKASEDA